MNRRQDDEPKKKKKPEGKDGSYMHQLFATNFRNYLNKEIANIDATDTKNESEER